MILLGIYNDDNEGENEVDFYTIDIISGNDSSDKSEENESGNENKGKNIRLDSNSGIPVVVVCCCSHTC